MVVYDLTCPSMHQFEGWFRSSNEFAQQHEQGLLRCPVCDSLDINRVPSASYINLGRGSSSSNEKRSNSNQALAPTINPAVMEKMREFIVNSSEDVGRQFPEEARKMHYGETEHRNIRGEATVKEIVDLHEEGIEAVPLPFTHLDNKKLN
ncbi:MAG: DUF1178 family protein [Gammaproteobacteria bacterium]|nr:DUF1178 family protein [Gammaproteobacteria bacterium]